MQPFRVERTRGGIAESVHRVSAAVVDPVGALVAWTGDPDLVTFWRSAAKPIQAIPLVEDGVLDHYGLGTEELALACASHSSEPAHLAVVERFLARIGCAEADLACGPHPPLSPAVAQDVAEKGTTLTPRWSNCSGKHAGMLALARHHGWPSFGYQLEGHPVQERLLKAVARWTGVPSERMLLAVDGCTTLCYGLPVRSMALAYARLGVSDEPAAGAIRDAMLRHPDLVAGESRFCTDLMRTMGGLVLAKIGAEGIYSAAIPGSRLGITLKVEDGDARAAALALLGLLRRLQTTLGTPAIPEAGLESYESVPIRNTRNEVTGTFLATGDLHFRDPK